MPRSLVPLLTVALSLTTSCVPRSPTPPSGREPLLLADSASHEAHWTLPDQLRIGPWAHGVAPLTVLFDGIAARYDAVVVERTIIRDLPRKELQRCSLTQTHLVAVQDSVNVLSFGGADFTLPVVPREDCLLDMQSNLSAPNAPYVMLWAPGSYAQGVSGSAAISRVAGSARPCPLALYDRRWRVTPPDARCELSDFDVQLDAIVDVREHQAASDSAPAETAITVHRQRVPGLRLIVFCSVNSSYPGCPAFSNSR